MNISEIKQFLAENQTWAKKNFGQHFLVDENVLDSIITAADLNKSDRVLEIGPGLGVLTLRLIKSAGEVVAVEADEFLAKFLEKKFSESQKSTHFAEATRVKKVKNQIYNQKVINRQPSSDNLGGENFQLSTFNFRLILGEALQVIDSWEFKRSFRSKPYKVVANIPYSITSRLSRLLLEDFRPTSITLLVQREVAERICAKPGEMSLLSLMVQYYGQPEIIRLVKQDSFWPAPKVESAIIRIGVRFQVLGARDESKLFKIARIGFSSKRKTLANNLSSTLKIERNLIVDIIKSVGLKETVRAQELSVGEWRELSEKLISITNIRIPRIYECDHTDLSP